MCICGRELLPHSGSSLSGVKVCVFLIFIAIFTGHMWYYMCNIHVAIDIVRRVCSDICHPHAMPISNFPMYQHGDISIVCLSCNGFTFTHHVYRSGMFAFYLAVLKNIHAQLLLLLLGIYVY